MTGGRSTPSSGPRHWYTIWAQHDKVVVQGKKPWLPILTGLHGPAAVTELTTRQDRLRRSGEPCRLVLLEDGEQPR